MVPVPDAGFPDLIPHPRGERESGGAANLKGAKKEVDVPISGSLPVLYSSIVAMRPFVNARARLLESRGGPPIDSGSGPKKASDGGSAMHRRAKIASASVHPNSFWVRCVSFRFVCMYPGGFFFDMIATSDVAAI